MRDAVQLERAFLHAMRAQPLIKGASLIGGENTYDGGTIALGRRSSGPFRKQSAPYATTMYIRVDMNGVELTIEVIVLLTNGATSSESNDPVAFRLCHYGCRDDPRVIQPLLPPD